MTTASYKIEAKNNDAYYQNLFPVSTVVSCGVCLFIDTTSCICSSLSFAITRCQCRSEITRTTPSITPTKIPDVVELDEIEPALIAKQAKLKVHFKTQSSQSCALEMKYPKISGLADSAWQAQLNEILRQEMMEKMGASEPMLDGDKCRKVTRKPGELHT